MAEKAERPRVAPEVVQRRLEWLGQYPELRLRLRLFAKAMAYGWIREGGGGIGNPFAGLGSVTEEFAGEEQACQ